MMNILMIIVVLVNIIQFSFAFMPKISISHLLLTRQNQLSKFPMASIPKIHQNHNLLVLNHQFRYRSSVGNSSRFSRSNLQMTINPITMSSSTITSQIKSILHALSNATNGANAFQSIQDLLINTSPSIYFTCLILAGLGLPISEDALCIFVGSILPIIWNEKPVFRVKLILALYLGVVLSDVVTFWVGRIMGKGLLEPMRKRINVRMERIEFCEDDTGDKEEDFESMNNDESDVFCEIETPELRAKDNILAVLEKAGNYAGFVVRFSIGMRLPLMLAAGFSGKVPLNQFIVGTSIGGMLSLSIQLLLGAAMRDNPAMIVATIACISATPVVMPSLIALLSWINVLYKRWSMFRPRRASS